jgi:Ca2+-binding EF-hand superfamily protein
MFERKPFAVLLFGLAFASAVAHSQTPQPQPQPQPQTRIISSQQWDMMQKTMRERFTAADKNGDGRLTREEANGKMPRVYDNFQIIDRGRKGYVTLQEIEKSVKDNVVIEGTAK